MQNKTIAVYADVTERYKFFKRMVDPAKELGYKILVVTAKYSIAKKAEKDGIEVITLKEKKDSDTPFLKINSLSVINNYHTSKEANHLYHRVYNTLSSQNKKIDVFFIWNGTTTIAMAIAKYCNDNNIKTVFLEISNIDNKLFADKKGTSSRSLLYSNPEILKNYSPKGKSLEYYKSVLGKKGAPKQVKNVANIEMSQLLDFYGFYFKEFLREDKRNPLKVIAAKIFLKIKPKVAKEGKKKYKEYIFLPLQVSNDSQLRLDNNPSNFDAIKKARVLAKEKKLDLVIKIHPAEPNINFIKSIESLVKESKDIYLTKDNTKDLIEKAEIVVTINSTVGLESLILEKETAILGKAIYKHFDTKEKLLAFLNGYLIEIDFFDTKTIKKENLQKVLKRGD